MIRGAALSLALVGAAQAQGTFLAQNGLLAIQFESADAPTNWNVSTSTPGFTGDAYWEWVGPNLFNNPGAQGIFRFDFEIQQAGTWRFSIRNRHEDPDPTEANDVWVRMDSGPWEKIFSNMAGSVGAWTWESRVDEGSQPEQTYSLSAGTHTIWFSGRSNGFKMDQFHLYLPGTPGATSTSTPESPRRFGFRYCTATNNSTGAVAVMDAFGTPKVADDNVILTTQNLPLNSLGYYLMSRNSGFQAMPGGSAGNLCLGGNIGRFAGNIINSGSIGQASFRIDLGDIPQPAGTTSVQAGETWHAQYWFRDAVGGTATSNFSRGLELMFE